MCWPGPSRWRSCVNRVPGLGEADAGRVAQALGDLPLALAQAAGYMAGTGTPAAEYLDLLAARAAQVLDQGRPAAYPRSLTAVTQLAFDRLRGEDPAAADLAAICAFLAPEPVPADWFPRAAAELPAPLAEAGGGPGGVAAGAGPGPAAGAGPPGPARAADAPAHPGDPARLPAARAGGRYPGAWQRRCWPPTIPATRSCHRPGPGGRGCCPTCSPLTPRPARRPCAT